MDLFKLFTDSEYRDQYMLLFKERVLPVLLGVGLVLIGVAFWIAGSKPAQQVLGTAGTVAATVATKGKNLVA